MQRLPCLLVAAVALAAPSSAVASDVLGVQVDRTRIETKLGHKFGFRTTISNEGSSEANGYIAHLNVLSYERGVYVDPEDWSGERTRYLEPIAPGESATIAWHMQAVNPGRFAVYVAVLPKGGEGERPTVGPTIAVAVAKRTTLNSSGILPLALGVPGLLCVAWLGVRTQRRRGSSPSRPGLLSRDAD